jgi:hypothetical protein
MALVAGESHDLPNPAFMAGSQGSTLILFGRVSVVSKKCGKKIGVFLQHLIAICLQCHREGLVLERE